MGLLNLGKDNWARTNPSKEGIVFLAISLFVGFAAVNTGNNLLYLAFGMMMSFIIASGVMSMINLARLQVSVVPPGDIFADSSSNLKFVILNKKPLIPSYSISIELGVDRAYIPHLPPGEEKPLSLSYSFERRGWNKIPEAKLSTRFPFGFFKKWIRIDCGDKDVLVYPRLQNVEIDIKSFQKNTDELKTEAMGSTVGKRGFGEDIRSIKEYNPGDNPKLIHWKTTAKRGRLMVREIEEDAENRKALLRFSPERKTTRLEPEISRVASTFLELKKLGFEVEFHSPDTVFSGAETNRSPSSVLAYLALYSI